MNVLINQTFKLRVSRTATFLAVLFTCLLWYLIVNRQSAYSKYEDIRFSGHGNAGDSIKQGLPPHEWLKTKRMFVFGDSYSSTWWDSNAGRPSESSPLGNTAQFKSTTDVRIPTYVDYLTTTYNESVLQTYCFGSGGATVDRSIVEPDFFAYTFDDQLDTLFAPDYVSLWDPDDTLFVIFFGVNDQIVSYLHHTPTPTAAILSSYAQKVEKLYKLGARRFVFMNVPPVDRVVPPSPEVHNLVYSIYEFNLGILDLRNNLILKHGDHSEVLAWVFDTNALWTQLLDKPNSFPQTAGILNTTAWCQDYAFGTHELNSLVENCGVRVDQYFWQNQLHATHPVHDATAAALVEDCFSAKGRNRFCS